MNILDEHPYSMLQEYVITSSNEMVMLYEYLEVCICKLNLTASSYYHVGFLYKSLPYDLAKGVQRS